MSNSLSFRSFISAKRSTEPALRSKPVQKRRSKKIRPARRRRSERRFSMAGRGVLAAKSATSPREERCPYSDVAAQAAAVLRQQTILKRQVFMATGFYCRMRFKPRTPGKIADFSLFGNTAQFRCADISFFSRSYREFRELCSSVEGKNARIGGVL
jgi:hypothetical protein